MKRRSYYSPRLDLDRLHGETRRQWFWHRVRQMMLTAALLTGLSLALRLHWPEAWSWLEAQAASLVERSGL